VVDGYGNETGARIKKPRKAEAMGTAAAEPLAVPEKKRRVDGFWLCGLRGSWIGRDEVTYLSIR